MKRSERSWHGYFHQPSVNLIRGEGILYLMTGKLNKTETRADALKRILKEEVDQAGCGYVSAAVLMEADIHCQSYDHVYYFLFGTLYCGIETSQGLIKQKAYYDPKLDAWFKVKCNKRYAT